MGLRDQILSQNDLPTEQLYVPEWNLTVYVRTMPGTERDAWEQDVQAARGDGDRLDNARAMLLVRVIADADGKPVFSTDDIGLLGQKSGGALTRIFSVAQRLNCLTAEDVEELVKNSKRAPRGASTSA